MKAVIITEYGKPDVMSIHEVDKPNVGNNDILVSVKAVGVNRADILQRRGYYLPPHGISTQIPGLEYSGVVERIGSQVTSWKVGDRVMGIAGGACYAEYVVVNEGEATSIPSDMSFESAAAIPEAFITCYDAMFLQGNLQHGQTILIHAIGSGVGTAALQLALMIGANIIGTSRSQKKLDKAKEYGEYNAILPENGLFSKKCLSISNNGVNLILDFIGGNYLKENLLSLKQEGIMVILGLLGGSSDNLPLNLLLQKRLCIKGSTLRYRSLEEKVSLLKKFDRDILPHIESRKLKPVIDVILPMDKVALAHEKIENNDVFGKIVLTWSDV